MTNQLEEFIEEKSIRCAYGVKPFIAGEKYIAVEDLIEFFKDKEIIDTYEGEDDEDLNVIDVLTILEMKYNGNEDLVMKHLKILMGGIFMDGFIEDWDEIKKPLQDNYSGQEE